MKRVFITSALLLVACGSSAETPTTTPVAPQTATPVEPAKRAVEVPEEAEPDAGSFVRVDLVTSDRPTAQAFYTALFGWTFSADGVIANGDTIIGTFRTFDAGNGVPLGWLGWISVVDVDDMLRDVDANGGRIVEPAADESPTRRRAIVAGATGGVFGVISGVSLEATAEPDVGDVYWHQLWTRDLPGALRFYQVIAGYTAVTIRFGKLSYMLLQRTDGKATAVAIATPPGRKTRWVPFIKVADVAASFKKARALKAKPVTSPREVPGIGTVAVVETPMGGVIGIITPVVDEDALDD